VNALPAAIEPNDPLTAVADLIRRGLCALDANEQEWAEHFMDFVEHVLCAREMHPDDAQFGEWWDRQDFQYQGRPLGRTDRSSILKIARRLREDPEQALIEIQRARSRKPRSFARTLPSGNSGRRRRLHKTVQPPAMSIHGDGTRAPGAKLYEGETAADWCAAEIDTIAAALEFQAAKIRGINRTYPGTLADDHPLLKLAKSIDKWVKARKPKAAAA
jgi:hypothetical protein